MRKLLRILTEYSHRNMPVATKISSEIILVLVEKERAVSLQNQYFSG